MNHGIRTSSLGSPPAEQPGTGQSDDDDTKHDIYFASKERVIYKFPVDPDGRYTREPETPAYSEGNMRHIHNVADPSLTDEKPGQRGPVLATLPLTQEPTAASVVLCYVINPNNLNYRNAYTSEEWFAPGAPEKDAPVFSEEFELVVAGPKGRIYHLHVKNEAPTDGGDSEREPDQEIRCVRVPRETLITEMDVWGQLRNGTVVGRVVFQNRVVPLVNVTSIQVQGGKS
jgi:hypothetical protein